MKGIIALFFCAIAVCCNVSWASDSLITDKKPHKSTAVSDSLRIPTFEYYPVTSNYVFNQTVINMLRWATVGAALGAGIGGINDACNDNYIFIPAALIGLPIGIGIGAVSGITFGIFKGVKMQKIKKDNPDKHAYRCRFGYEFNYLEFTLIGNSKGITRNHRYPCFSIVYRPLMNKALIPSKVSLGMFSDFWGRTANYEVNSLGRLYFHKIEAIIQYNFIQKRLFIPYWAAGIGYTWGQESEEITEMYTKISDHRIASPLLRGYVGCEINVFDFLYMDFKLGYEAIGPYLAAHHKKYYPYGGNIICGFSLGTYIF